MNVIEPIIVTDAVLLASSVPETDHPAWSTVATYAPGDRVMVLATHSIYEAVTASTGQTPVGNDGTHWLRLGATNRWRAFDQIIGDAVAHPGDITYSLAPPEIMDAAAFFGLDAAAVTVTVTNALGAVVYSTTVSLVDRTEAVSWFAWFYDPIIYDTEALVVGFPGFPGSTVAISITGAGTTRVGQIVPGRDQSLGRTNTGTSTGIEDFSRKERDEFGRAGILERAFIDRVSFQFSFPPEDARRVKRVLARLRATPAVYYAGDDTTAFGTTVYGFYRDFDIPLTVGVSFATLEIEGLA